MRLSDLEKKEYLIDVFEPDVFCFIHIQLFDDEFETFLKNVDYTIKGEFTDTIINGTTDDEGILKHEKILDDFYVLGCRGKNEVIDVFYMDEINDYGGSPIPLRMRGVVD